MLFGRLICWIIRKRGGKHRYGLEHYNSGIPDVNITFNQHRCVRCGHKKRKPKMRKLKVAT